MAADQKRTDFLIETEHCPQITVRAKASAALLLALCLGNLAAANEIPRTVAPEKSAWAAGLSAAQVGERVASQVMRQERFPPAYPYDLQLESLLTLGDTTGRKEYLEFVSKKLSERKFRPGYDMHSYVLQMFSCMPFEMYKRTHNADYVEPFLAESRKYREHALRSSDGVISFYFPEWAVLPHEGIETIYLDAKLKPIYIDQAQEYASRMAKAGWLSDDPALYREAAEQFRLLRAALRDSGTGLWAHGRGWYDSPDSVVDTKWGRGHGWLLRGMIEALSYLPADSPESRQVTAMLAELAGTLVKYQDKEGFLHTVIDRLDSYQETSATGFLSYYLARAVRQGFLPERPYRDASVKAFQALTRKKVSADGIVYGGSQGTPPMRSVDLYMTWKTPINDHHAVSAVILSAAGQVLLDGKGVIRSRGH